MRPLLPVAFAFKDLFLANGLVGWYPKMLKAPRQLSKLHFILKN